MTMIVRGMLLLWAAAFGLLGLRGLIDPAVFTAQFGLIGDIARDPGAANTLRADFAAFFLVAAGGAVVGALRRGWARALWVPAALFGTACLCRALGLALGDTMSASVQTAMIVEALTAVLMIGAARLLSRSS